MCGLADLSDRELKVVLPCSRPRPDLPLVSTLVADMRAAAFAMCQPVQVAAIEVHR